MGRGGKFRPRMIGDCSQQLRNHHRPNHKLSPSSGMSGTWRELGPGAVVAVAVGSCKAHLRGESIVEDMAVASAYMNHNATRPLCARSASSVSQTNGSRVIEVPEKSMLCLCPAGRRKSTQVLHSAPSSSSTSILLRKTFRMMRVPAHHKRGLSNDGTSNSECIVEANAS